MQLRAASLAADEYLGPGRDGFLQHGFEVDRGRLVNDRAHARGFVHRIAAGVFLGFLGEPAGELGRDAFLDQNAFHRGAALAGIAEAALRRERDRQVQVGVVEHDERIVAAQFEHQPFVARRSRDAFAHAALGGEELDRFQRQAVLAHHLSHHFADGAGGAHNGNVRLHVQRSFHQGRMSTMPSVSGQRPILAREPAVNPVPVPTLRTDG